MNTTREPADVRFWRHVNLEGPFPVDSEIGRCWVWRGKPADERPALFRVTPERREYAHRWIYVETYGPVPGGHSVVRICQHTRCVRPSHLRAVPTAALGPMFATAIFRPRDQCAKGHAMTPENVYVSTNKATGKRSRRCRQCCRDWQREYARERRRRERAA